MPRAVLRPETYVPRAILSPAHAPFASRSDFNTGPNMITGRCGLRRVGARLRCFGSRRRLYALHELEDERVDLLGRLVVRAVADARQPHDGLDRAEALERSHARRRRPRAPDPELCVVFGVGEAEDAGAFLDRIRPATPFLGRGLSFFFSKVARCSAHVGGTG